MNYPPQFPRKWPRRSKAWLVAIEYLMWPGKRPHGLLKALAYANNISPARLNTLASTIRNGRK